MTKNNKFLLFQSLRAWGLMVSLLASVGAAASTDLNPPVKSQPVASKICNDLTGVEFSITASPLATPLLMTEKRNSSPSLSKGSERLFETQQKCKSSPGSIFFDIGEGWKY